MRLIPLAFAREPQMLRTNPVEHWSALGDLEMVLAASSEGHDVNARGDNGYTALHAAVANQHRDVVRVLLEHGAVPTMRLDTGETPMQLALLVENHGIIALLSQYD